MPRERVLLLGVGDAAEEVHAELRAAGARVVALPEPDDDAIRAALRDRPEVVVVVSPDDAVPLRLALLVRHLDPEVPLLVTIFDPALAEQAVATIPGCDVTSVADLVAPSMAAACLDPELAAIRTDGAGGLLALRDDGGSLREEPYAKQSASRIRPLLTSIFRPYDKSAALLFYGFLGLIAILAFETIGAMVVLDEGFADALYDSTKSLTTVGPNDNVGKGPGYWKIAIVAAMLGAVLSAACFTGGLINRLAEARFTGLVGRRSVPRSNHVVVVGLGQVGLRLALLLRECGVPVVAVDTQRDGPNVAKARTRKLPVAVGRGKDPTLLRRLGLRNARALALVLDDDLGNIESAMAARGFAPDLRVLLRAGDGEVAEETGSLLRIGHVVDVHRLGAASIAARALGADVVAVALRDGHPHLLLADGSTVRSPRVADR